MGQQVARRQSAPKFIARIARHIRQGHKSQPFKRFAGAWLRRLRVQPPGAVEQAQVYAANGAMPFVDGGAQARFGQGVGLRGELLAQLAQQRMAQRDSRIEPALRVVAGVARIDMPAHADAAPPEHARVATAACVAPDPALRVVQHQVGDGLQQPFVMLGQGAFMPGRGAQKVQASADRPAARWRQRRGEMTGKGKDHAVVRYGACVTGAARGWTYRGGA